MDDGPIAVDVDDNNNTRENVNAAIAPPKKCLVCVGMIQVLVIYIFKLNKFEYLNWNDNSNWILF